MITQKLLENINVTLENASYLQLARTIHRNHKNKKLEIPKGSYLYDIYNDINSYICIKKATQCCISEYLLVRTIKRAINGKSILYILPTFSLKNQFVQERTNKTILFTKAYQNLLNTQDKKLAESLSIKQFGTGTIIYTGSNTSVAFISNQIDDIIIDELDECAQEFLPMAEERQSASTDRTTIKVGNPTITGYGIDAEYLNSDRKEWNIRCSSCNKFINPDFFKHIIRIEENNLILLDDEWNRIDGEPKPICHLCGKPYDRYASGEWVKYQKHDHSGYTISKMFSTLVTIKEQLIRFSEGLTNDTIMQRFYNGDQGKSYIAKGSKITDDIIKDCIKDYNMPEFCDGICVMGVDVGKKLHVRINEIFPNGRKRAVYIGTVTEKEEIKDLWKRYKCKVGIIDALPETRMSKKLSYSFKGMFMCEYSHGIKDIVDKNYKIVKCDRTQALDSVKEMFAKQEIDLPQNIYTVDDYTDQLKSSTRIFDEKSDIYKWVESGPDHYLHAEVYALKAEKLLFLLS